MYEVMTRFPTLQSMLEAPPSVLGLAVLHGIAAIHGPREQANTSPRPLRRREVIDGTINGVGEGVPIRIAAGEAVSWLYSHDLLADLYHRSSSDLPTVVITKLGYAVLESGPDAVGAATHALRVTELIPESIRVKVIAPLIAGDYDVAIANAFKAVEVRMRQRANLSTGDFGSRLTKQFFKRVIATQLQRADRRGSLADEEHLFEGLFGLYRDRAVHEAPHIDSMQYALEVVIAASHLLRIVDAAELQIVSDS